MSSAAYTMRSARENKGPPSTDLLVCFPPRKHLALMPKPIYSPAWPDPGPRRHARRPSNRGIFSGGIIGHASPQLRANGGRRHNIDSNSSEPTSPKVTCAGQIKIKNSNKPASSCRNWQSVMEEIERLHNSRRRKKKKSHAAWAGAVQFLSCLRNIRFDFRCFGSFPASVDDVDDGDECEEGDGSEEYDDCRENIISGRSEMTKEESNDDDDDDNRTVFSKWFMVLQDEEDRLGNEGFAARDPREEGGGGGDGGGGPPCVPPANALLLMRCRSAPLNEWLQEEKDEERKEKERLLVMTCGEDFAKLSSDVAKETWVVGAAAGALSRSRSCRR